MIHPDTCLKFINEEVGFGVVATKFIPKGTITWVQDKFDRKLKPEQLKDLDPLFSKTLDTYSYRDSKGNYIYCWDNGRFVNHSFNSNCLTTAYNYELAIRDINPGEELTDDYGYLNIESPFTPLEEKESNRTVVYPDDLLKFHPIWDAKLLESFKVLPNVNQPLRPLIKDKIWETSIAIAANKKKMKSIASCYYSEKETNNNYQLL